jgi:hypothetical protein
MIVGYGVSELPRELNRIRRETDAVRQIVGSNTKAAFVGSTRKRDVGHLQPQLDQGPDCWLRGGDVLRQIALSGKLQYEAEHYRAVPHRPSSSSRRKLALRGLASSGER